MRKSTLKVWAFLLACFSVVTAAAVEYDTTVVKKWDLTVWSDASVASLTADETNWSKEYNSDNTEIRRFKNVNKTEADMTIMADGKVLPETDGLLWPSGLSTGNLNIRHNYGDDGVQTGSKNKVIKIAAKDGYPKAGQVVVIRQKSASASEARGIAEVTNLEGTVGASTYSLNDTCYTLTVVADGEVSFKYSGGIIWKSIEILEIKEKEAIVVPAFAGGNLVQTDTVEGKFPLNTDCYFAMFGTQKEYLNGNLFYSYANGNQTASAKSLDQNNAAYFWEILPSEIEGEYYMKNVGTGLYISAFEGAEYSPITLGETPVSLIMEFVPNTTVGQKGSSTTQKDCGQAYAENAAFRIRQGTAKILIRGGTIYRNGQSGQTRCDFLEFFYGVSKVDVYKNLLAETIASAKLVNARVITEGTEAWNYTPGLKAALGQAITNAEAADLTSLVSMQEACEALQKAVTDFENGFVLPEGKYTIASADSTLDETAQAFTKEADKAAIFNGEKVGNQVIFKLKTDFVGMTGLTADETRFSPVVDNGLVSLYSNGQALTISGVSQFTIAPCVVALPAELKSISHANGATEADTTQIVLVYDKAIKLLNAELITLNEQPAQVALSASGDSLIISNKLTIKTNYTLKIAEGALSNADDESLKLEALEVSFRTFSPYLRDKQTMLASGFNGVYALFGEGNSNGYMNTERQIALNNDNALYCGLNGTNRSQWRLALMDAEARTWSIQNYVTNQYLAYNAADSTLALSDSPVAWQISKLADGSGASDWMPVYTFWPAVEEGDLFYDCAVCVAEMKVLKAEPNGKVAKTAFAICPMESLTKADMNNYNAELLWTIGARNDGRVWNQKGSDVSFDLIGDLENAYAGYWMVTRREDGRYSFKNSLTGQYVTYNEADTTVKAMPYDAEKDMAQSWVIMDHCAKGSDVFYTVQGLSYATSCDKTEFPGKVGLTARNGGNAIGAQGLARIHFKPTNIPVVSLPDAPVVTVPSVDDNSIMLNWTANEYAAAYKVIYGGDSILLYDEVKIDSIVGIDETKAQIDTIAELSFRITGLENRDVCYYQVIALSSKGYLGKASTIDSAQTISLAEFTPPAPAVVEDKTEMKSLTFAWAANEQAAKYIFAYSLKEDMADATTIETAELSATINDLPANTMVYATLQIKSDKDVLSKVSSVGSGKTASYSLLVPATPVLAENGATANSLKLVWEAATDAVAYKLRISRSKNGVVNAEPIDVPNATEYIAEELNANANYYFTIQAVDAAGNVSSQSEIGNAKTLAAVALDVEKQAVAIYAKDQVLFIEAAEAGDVAIFNLVGKQVRTLRIEQGLNQVSDLEAGQIYLVRTAKTVTKVVL